MPYIPMLWRLFQHKLKSFFRSPAFTQQLAQTIVLGLLFLYLGLNFLFLGYIGGKFLKEEFPDTDLYEMVGGIMVYYFLYALIMRAIIQKFPILDIKKYLGLNTRKSTLTHFLLLSSLISFFNFLPLFGIVPFVLSNYDEMHAMSIAWPFLVLCIGWILANNYLGFLLDRLFKKGSYWPYMIIGILMILMYLDYQGYIFLTGYFRIIWVYILVHPILTLIPWLAALFFYFVGFRFIKNNLYIEDLLPRKISEARNIHLGFLDRFGMPGKLILLEIKLILRNKRSRAMVFIAMIMLAYPLIFIGSDTMSYTWIKLFIGTFVTGMFALNYGQLMLSWNSTHFDLLATRKIKIEDIFRAKYYIMAFSCIILFLPAMLYGFLSLEFMWIFPIMFLYNIGVTIFIYMFLASHNSKKIDLSKGAVMNYEGISAAHFLIMIPIIIIPLLIRWPLARIGHPVMGEALIALIGLTGFIFHNQLISIATNYFKKNRYKIMAAFRKN